MNLDKDLIQGKIDIIEKDLKFLQTYKTTSEDAFLSSFKDIQAVKFSLFEIIEACIDIASYIISTKGYERADSYAEMFEILGKENIVDVVLSKNLSEMAKFRNILIHGYAKVDNSKVLFFVKEELKDVEDFIKRVLALLKREEEPVEENENK